MAFSPRFVADSPERVESVFGAAIVGAGPAGTGSLVSAHQRARLNELLDTRLLFIEASDEFCVGTIGRFAIRSDTYADTLLECVAVGEPAILESIRRSPILAEVEKHRGGSLPLTLVAAFLKVLGDSLRNQVQLHAGCGVIQNTTVRSVRRTIAGQWLLTLDGVSTRYVLADRVIVACGGVQRREHALISPIAHQTTLQSLGVTDRVVTSDELLATGGPERLARRLACKPCPRVTIIGGSHSAMSSAWTLLNLTSLDFHIGAITILHNRPFRLFYQSRDEALADNYTDFDDTDFCPVTNRLYRLAGLRMESRALGRRVLGIGDAMPEPRIQLQPLDRRKALNAAQRDAIEEADVIITAFGYRPNGPDFYDSEGKRILLQSDDAELARPMVDTQCRVLDASGDPLPNAYGVGLASGFRYTGALGGEPSFTGQTNGLWLYQNGIGEMLCHRMLEPAMPASGKPTYVGTR